MAGPVIQSVWVTDATRNPEMGGLSQWKRTEYDVTLDMTGRSLLDAIREHTSLQTPGLGVPRSDEWANGAVVIRWQDPDGRPDLRRVRFEPHDDERGVRIGGCPVHRPTECIALDVFPTQYDPRPRDRWPPPPVHTRIGALEASLAHAACDWGRPPSFHQQDYVDAACGYGTPLPGPRCCQRPGAWSWGEIGQAILAVEVLEEWLPRRGGSLSTFDTLLGWRVHGLWTDWCDWPGWSQGEPLDPEVRMMWATQSALRTLG